MQDLSSQKNSYTIKRKKKERNQDRQQMVMNQKDKYQEKNKPQEHQAPLQFQKSMVPNS